VTLKTFYDKFLWRPFDSGSQTVVDVILWHLLVFNFETLQLFITKDVFYFVFLKNGKEGSMKLFGWKRPDKRLYKCWFYCFTVIKTFILSISTQPATSMNNSWIHILFLCSNTVNYQISLCCYQIQDVICKRFIQLIKWLDILTCNSLSKL